MNQILAALVAVAAAVPLEDTMDVKEAKAMFYKAFEEAEMGKLAEKQEMQIPNSKTTIFKQQISLLQND